MWADSFRIEILQDKAAQKGGNSRPYLRRAVTVTVTGSDYILPSFKASDGIDD